MLNLNRLVLVSVYQLSGNHSNVGKKKKTSVLSTEFAMICLDIFHVSGAENPCMFIHNLEQLHHTLHPFASHQCLRYIGYVNTSIRTPL